MTDQQADEKILSTLNPLVFISHDTRDAELAEAFSNLLKSVSTGILKSFRTSDRRGNQGIEFGVEWYPEIIKNIQEASDVVCLLTKQSVDRPWILFEAGMAKGKLNTPILGVALGIDLKDASTGPFAQFQNCSDDEDSLIKLVFQLVKKIPNSEPDRDTIKLQVGKFKNTVTEILNKNGTNDATINESANSSNIKDIENSSAKLFEEIKIMFQDLPSRIDRDPTIRRKRKRLHPKHLEELITASSNPKYGVYIALSLYREKMPWIYDEGVSLIRKIESSKSGESCERYARDFEELLMTWTRNPMIEDLLFDEKDDYFLMMDLPRAIMKGVERIVLFNIL